MFGPISCRDHLDQYGFNYTVKLLEVLIRDNENELALLPDDLKQFNKDILYPHVRQKIDENDKSIYMF